MKCSWNCCWFYVLECLSFVFKVPGFKSVIELLKLFDDVESVDSKKFVKSFQLMVSNDNERFILNFGFSTESVTVSVHESFLDSLCIFLYS